MPYVKKAENDRRLKRIAELEQRLKDLGEDTESQDDDDQFDILEQDIENEAKTFKAHYVSKLILDEICIKMNCREEAFVMENGTRIRVQPFRLTDSEYKVVTRDMLDRIIRETKVDEIQYEAEEYDCEDIARKFVTRCSDLGINSVGRVFSWSGGHSFCIAIIHDGDDLEIVFIEPQTDEIFMAGKGKYSLENALIIIS